MWVRVGVLILGPAYTACLFNSLQTRKKKNSPRTNITSYTDWPYHVGPHLARVGEYVAEELTVPLPQTG